MADLKISQLPSATTLAGTEVLAVVQGGVTKKVSQEDILTVGAGKGVNFSQNGGGVLLTYKEGAFTPVVAGTTTVGTATYSAQLGRYTRIGNRVIYDIYVQWSGHTGAGNMLIRGLPFPSLNVGTAYSSPSCYISGVSSVSPGNFMIPYIGPNRDYINMAQSQGFASYAPLAISASGELILSGTYEV